MAEVKWIKIVTDVFNNKKIKQIEKLPDADTLLVIWFKILCLAGDINESGLLMLTKDVPYTEEMLANEFRREICTIRFALSIFEKFHMIEIIDDILCVSNWEKYQNIESLDKIREQTRKRVSSYREKQKCLASSNVTCNVTVTQCNATEEEREKELDKDKEIRGNKSPHPYGEIKDYFNKTCVSLPKIMTLSDTRKKTLKGLVATYSLEKVKEVFNKAEQSDFMKGINDRKWNATFDWIIKPANFIKILEGNYDNKQSQGNFGSFETEEFFQAAVEAGKRKYGG